ncbi:hypothetical protein MKX01_028037 [Papaver californicum]|nr:hypothetical protein MKX01_028037 [Papaver californicum]
MDISEKKKDGRSGGEKPNSIKPVAFKELFRLFADRLDYVLMGIGTVGALVHGCSLPVFLRFFADLVNSFGPNANNVDKMMQEVLKYAFYFLVVGAAIWASSWSGQRNSFYFNFSKFCSYWVVVGLGNFNHYMATFVSGFVVGFTAAWQLALVTLAVVPLIAIVGGIQTTTLAKLSIKSQEALSEAGNIAEQIGYKTGFAKGMGLGATYFVVFRCYALLLWYGGYLVRHDYTNGGLAISTMFAVMIGGIGLAQSAPSISAFANAKVAAAKTFRVIDHNPSIRKNESGLELNSVTGHIELKNVEFSYPSRPDVKILCDISLNVQPGKTIALQGCVSEIGTHEELFLKGENGFYAKLISMQETSNEAAPNNGRKSSASCTSPATSCGYNKLCFLSGTIIGRNSSYGRSPYSRRLSDFSTSEFSLSLDGTQSNYRLEKLAFKDQASTFLRLAKMNSPEWVYALFGSIGSVICGSISAFFSYVLGAVMSVYYSQDYVCMRREIGKYCYFLIGVSSAAPIFNTLQHYYWDVVGENLTKRVREKMLASIMKNEMAWFDQEENESGRIAARLALDANNVRSAIGDRISVITQNSSLMLVACTAGFVLEWRLALLLIAVFPVVVAATVLQKMSMKGFSGDLEGSHAKATQLAGEAVSNVRTVAAFNSEEKIVGLFSSNLEIPLKRCFWKGQNAGSGYGVAQFLLYASYALGLWYASWLVKHGISDFSKTIWVFMVLMVSANGAAETVTLAPDFIKGGQALKSVFDLLDRRTEIEPDELDSTPAPETLRGEVEFKHVDFAYPSRPGSQIFRDLTLRARTGKTLALVGPSGCGKSSVISLVQRFYEPTSGRVLIDGKDIRKYNLKSLRKHIAMVPQEPCLFAATIHENIAYGSESATEAEVIEAATLANAHKFISALPEGYNTWVGERGIQLSGGQRQRIAIARGLIKKAQIMLLDEATSALDAESERSVQEALERASSGRTTIIVAHRLSTIRNANVIAVIDEGKVVEQGSHSHLLKHNPDGCYASMIQLQRFGKGAQGIALGPSSSSGGERKV